MAYHRSPLRTRFELSGSEVRHRIDHIQELPVNNTIQTLPDLNTEPANQLSFFPVLDAVKADTSVIIVNFQIPGGDAMSSRRVNAKQP
jgi:hypothetical protein